MRRLIFITILAATLISAMAASAPRKNRAEAATQRAERKADMLYLEALRYKQSGDVDAFVELVTEAYKTNPADTFLASEYGNILLAITEPGDSDVIEKAYDMVRAYAMDGAGAGAGDFYVLSKAVNVASRLGHNDDARTMLHRLYTDNPDRPEVAAAYAQSLASTGRKADIDRALAVYDTIEARDGLTIPLTTLRLRVYLQQADTTAILNEVRRLTEAAPTVAENAVMAGDVYAQMGRNDSALTFYNKAIELDPASGVAYYSRANLYLSMGDSTAYDREIFLALGQPDLDVETKTELMRDYVSKLYREPSQRERISSLFDRLIATHPHESVIHGLYGDYLAAIGQYGAAAEQVSYETDLDPSDPERWRMLCSLYLTLEDYDRAVETVETATGFFPDDTQLPLMGAAAFTNAERPKDAIDLLDKALANTTFDDETRSNLLTSRGDAFYKLGLPDSAFIDYDEAIRLNPANFLAMNNAAYFLACSDRDLEHALNLITRASAGRPDDATVLDTYAWVEFKRCNYDKARELIDRTLALMADQGEEISAEVLEHAGDIYFMLREPDTAVEFWKRALELEPDSRMLKRKVTEKTYFYDEK